MDILQHEQIVSDKLQGVIRNPFAFYFEIRRDLVGRYRHYPCVMRLYIGYTESYTGVTEGIYRSIQH